jgi:hypothetical protein
MRSLKCIFISVVYTRRRHTLNGCTGPAENYLPLRTVCQHYRSRVLPERLNCYHIETKLLRSYLKEKVAAPVYKIENTAVGIRHADHVAPSIRKSWH